MQTKCLELIALKLEPDTSGERELMRSRILRGDDIERIYHARAILISDFDNPPSLLELVRQVGLNDYKLKIGFRQVFKTTVFGYLWAYRMEKARTLIMSQQMTIKQVAKIVGYDCPSRFAMAFKKRFLQTLAALYLDHHFNSNLSLKSMFRYTASTESGPGATLQIFGDTEDDRTFELGNSIGDQYYETYSWQNDLTAKVKTGAIQHTVLLGFELTRQKSFFSARDRSAGFIDVFNPSYNCSSRLYSLGCSAVLPKR